MDEEIGLHAHNLVIRGGSVSIGSEEEPFRGEKAFIELHGDMYVYGKGPPLTAYALHVYKRIDVQGHLGIFGEPRVAMARIDGHLAPGNTSFRVSHAVDWRPGERLVMAGAAKKFANFDKSPDHFSTGYNQFEEYPITPMVGDGSTWPTAGAAAAGAYMHQREQHEFLIVGSVSADGLTVTLDPSTPIVYHHAGEIIEQNGVTMDVRDTVAMLDRNVEIRGGDDEVPTRGFKMACTPTDPTSQISVDWCEATCGENPAGCDPALCECKQQPARSARGA